MIHGARAIEHAPRESGTLLNLSSFLDLENPVTRSSHIETCATRVRGTNYEPVSRGSLGNDLPYRLILCGKHCIAPMVNKRMPRRR